MIASWQTIVLYFVIAGRPVFLVLLLHTISGPSTARTISAPLRRTSRCIQKLAASPPNRSPAQRIRFGSGGARKRADNVFIKKRQPRLHHRANQRSVCAVKERSSRMSARRVLKKLVASPQTEAQRSGFGLDKEEQGSGRMTFLEKNVGAKRTLLRRGGGGWIRFSAEKPGGCGVPPAHRQEPPSLVLTSFVSLVPPYTPGLAHFAARPLPNVTADAGSR